MLKAAEDILMDLARSCAAQVEYFEELLISEIISEEEKLTARLAQSLETTLNFKSVLFNIEAKLIDTHKQKEEPRLGADLLIISSFSSPELELSQGVLVQSKILPNGNSMGSFERMEELRSQCESMLLHTQQSYVWFYDGQPERPRRANKAPPHSRIIRAALVQNLAGNHPDIAHSIYSGRFMYDLLMGYIGDIQLNLHDYSRIVKVINKLGIRYIILISSSAGPELKIDIYKDHPKKPYQYPPDLDEVEKRLKNLLNPPGPSASL